ncbi:cofactor FMO1 enzyme is FAD [Cucurbitaria berberidis CBS 394.84]|uniref:Cofactor FMO1 enzyme is FAD n=1 Tax=Cucurbitaria berberidis CBS 394.84 TaxID=1168544 RepID=A0A9P4L4R8_9PLEO|nr:cofactor FMO1 enzyme is FAD [Cucurbitaria berberidis CBS 394.84]KAF1841193.1 cofactor FMO1 enzyme is FAD [Cucurbitaria berberidis CBS 394.84]
MSQAMENFDTIVVGAGWYGLMAARTYLELAPETNLLIVDDSGTVGGVWSKERIYPSLFAQISHPLFEYSFYPMSKDDMSPDGFVSGKTIHNYLDSFARDHNLLPRLRLKTRVERVRRGPSDSGGWILDIKEGNPLSCDKLIYATGANSSPIIPTWPNENFERPVIHSLDLGRQQDYIARDVQTATVVGRSKSSYDAVYHLLCEGKKVNWVMRNGLSGPFSLYAPTFMGLWNIADHISTRFASSFSPCIMATSGFCYDFFQRNAVGQMLTNVYWRTANYLSVSHAEYWRTPNAEKLRPRPYSDGVCWGSGGIGIATAPDFWKVFHRGNITIYETEIESLSHRDVVNLKNGYSVATDIVIHCTGFDKGYSTFDPELREELGLQYGTKGFSLWSLLDAKADKTVDELLPYLRTAPKQYGDADASRSADQGPNRHFRRLVVPELAARGDRSILFPGHIHSAFTPLAAELQALWGVSWMLGWRDLPPREEMEFEAATFNAWTRKRYLEQGKKHSYFIYDYIPYIDTLMKDLGLNPFRKSNVFEEWFVRYKPSDYSTILDEYRNIRHLQLKYEPMNGHAQGLEDVAEKMNGHAVEKTPI